MNVQKAIMALGVATAVLGQAIWGSAIDHWITIYNGTTTTLRYEIDGMATDKDTSGSIPPAEDPFSSDRGQRKCKEACDMDEKPKELTDKVKSCCKDKVFSMKGGIRLTPSSTCFSSIKIIGEYPKNIAGNVIYKHSPGCHDHVYWVTEQCRTIPDTDKMVCDLIVDAEDHGL